MAFRLFHVDGSFFTKRFSPPLASALAFLVEVIQVGVMMTLLVWGVRTFLFKPFDVVGASMEPSFYDGEYLIINELGYLVGEPSRGDVAVFRYPQEPSEYFIKRVIGLPGETVQISQNVITIYTAEFPNGFRLDEPYLQGRVTRGERRVVLGRDEYYVLGDNREASLDSRMFGPVKETYLVGRVWFRGWPLGRIGTFDNPVYLP